MKFDIVVGNPPYQTKSDKSNTNTQAIWDKFVKMSFEICKDNGYVTLIHPSGWRNVKGIFKETQNLLASKDVKYLEIHDYKDGLKTFGAETRYDWYVASNSKNSGKTKIVGKNSETCQLDLSKHEFIPNGLFKEIQNLLAKDDEPTVSVLRDASKCHTQKKWISKEKTDEFCYPCIYLINSKDGMSLRFSKYKKGHFGISKLIWSNGNPNSVGSFIDLEGEYGLTQFAYAITDTKKNLHLIKKAFDSDRFRSIIRQCSVGQSSINYRVIALFRKDFWKEFI